MPGTSRSRPLHVVDGTLTKEGSTDDIIRYGLHEYLMDFLQRVSVLGAEISRRFLVPTH